MNIDTKEVGMLLVAAVVISFLSLVVFPKEIHGVLIGLLAEKGDYAKSLNPANLIYSMTAQGYQFTIMGISVLPANTSCTGSMEPTFGCKSTVLVEILEQNDKVNINDIVGYDNRYGKSILHRITRYDSKNDCWIFKGDASILADDECVKRGKMTARVIGVFYTK